MPEETVEITDEDNMMLLKLIASLSDNTYPQELDWEGLMSSLDVVHSLGAEVCIIWGSSMYISMGEEYFDRLPTTEDLGLQIFRALHHFSHWYLKHKQ